MMSSEPQALFQTIFPIYPSTPQYLTSTLQSPFLPERNHSFLSGPHGPVTACQLTCLQSSAIRLSAPISPGKLPFTSPLPPSRHGKALLMLLHKTHDLQTKTGARDERGVRESIHSHHYTAHGLRKCCPKLTSTIYFNAYKLCFD